MIYIFDLDGTLANIEHRLHFIQQEPKDWNAFFMAADKDAPIHEVIAVNRALAHAGHTLIMITGCDEMSRQITEEWLNKYMVIFDGLYMRKHGDHREDSIVKAELLDHMIQDKRKLRIYPVEIAGVFEDRQQVVDAYRARGLRVFQVAEGNF